MTRPSFGMFTSVSVTSGTLSFQARMPASSRWVVSASAIDQVSTLPESVIRRYEALFRWLPDEASLLEMYWPSTKKVPLPSRAGSRSDVLTSSSRATLPEKDGFAIGCMCNPVNALTWYLGPLPPCPPLSPAPYGSEQPIPSVEPPPVPL